MRCSLPAALALVAGVPGVLFACATSDPVESPAGTGSGPGAGAAGTPATTGGALLGGGSTGGSAIGGTASGGTLTGGTGNAGTGATTGGTVAGTCFDGVRNGTEGDTDCGGTCEAKCQLWQSCDILVDCEPSLTCYQQQCTHCGNGVQDEDETDVDCGPTCGLCLGEDCSAADAECGPPNVCGPDQLCTHCGNDQQDQDETDVDCGGSCLKCDGDDCEDGTECAIGSCYELQCGLPPCLADWRSKETEAEPCLSAVQGDQLECYDILDCYFENDCGPGSCPDDNTGLSMCRATEGTAGETLANQVYSNLCD